MAAELDCASFRDLMDGLATGVDEYKRAHQRGLQAFLTGIGPVVDMASVAQTRLDLIAATRFSVFDYFKKNENNLSAIFADLMHPDGTHGQGATFLDHFLEQVEQGKGGKSIRSRQAYGDLRRFEISTEHHTDHGRKIDIVLREGKHWIAIENKPWADEQDDQLRDYLVYVQGRDKRSCVLYLNGRGEESATIPPEKTGSYLMIPYKAGGSGPSVYSWIDKCLKSCRADSVRWFLRDLRDYIDREFKEVDVGRIEPDEE